MHSFSSEMNFNEMNFNEKRLCIILDKYFNIAHFVYPTFTYNLNTSMIILSKFRSKNGNVRIYILKLLYFNIITYLTLMNYMKDMKINNIN